MQKESQQFLINVLVKGKSVGLYLEEASNMGELVRKLMPALREITEGRGLEITYKIRNVDLLTMDAEPKGWSSSQGSKDSEVAIVATRADKRINK
jgi:hypothetical protein